MIPFSETPKLIDQKENVGVFQIEALYPGYGPTVGNSMRRVLLSSLEGAAVSRVHIDQVEHEFSTISGVHEDVIMILLNLKQIRMKVHSDEPQVATLKVKGEKDVTAADIETPPEVEIMNPGLHIASLTDKKAELSMEIHIEKGVGYVLAEDRKKEKESVGSISLDTAFNPVRNVRYNVENMRVGEQTNFDRLTLEIETDGTVTPETAFHQAANILQEQFRILTEGIQPKEVEPTKKSGSKAKKK